LTVTVAAVFQGGLGLLGGLLLTFSSSGLGAPSTRSLASFRPRLVRGAHLLDDLDLLVARGLEDDVELVLLLDPASAAAAGGRRAAIPARARP
jgi:hypothetical protein